MAAIDAVVDISHHNGPNLDFQKAKAAGILGVIHKATQGHSSIDPMYAANKKKALKAGLLWGAYHFATGADGVDQATAFLNALGNDASSALLVLDFEPNPSGSSMTLEEARAFVTHVHSVTGRWPGFYSGHYIKQLLGTNKDPVLANCWLWLAQYGPTAVVPPNWPTWTMWQYTDGAVNADAHSSVDGIGHCDRDRFNGSEKRLRALWGVA